jgi:hypothetical protein
MSLDQYGKNIIRWLLKLNININLMIKILFSLLVLCQSD